MDDLPPVIILFFNIDIYLFILPLLGVYFLASLGMSAVGTLFSAMLVNIRMKDILMPLLTYPLLTPLLISAVALTRALIFHETPNPQWIKMIITYDIIFMVAGFILYEYLLEE